jgi:ABC-type multidrug transport system fused ATPase/permease subunit
MSVLRVKPKRGDEELTKKNEDEVDDNESSSSPPLATHHHDTNIVCTTEVHDAKKEQEKSANKDEARAAGGGEMESEAASFSKLMSVARPEWPMIFLAFVLMIVAEVGNLINPILLANAYDYLIAINLTPPERMSQINRVMILVLIIHVAGMMLTFAQTTILGMTGERVVARLRNRLYANILKQEISFFDQHKSGELVSRLGSDTTLLQQATSTALPEIVLGMVQIVACIFLMFWISASLAALTLGLVFVMCLVCGPLGALMGRLSKLYQDTLGVAQTHSTEAFGAMRTVQSFAAEEREAQRYGRLIGDPDSFPWWWPSKPPKRNKDSADGTGAAAAAWTTTYRAGVLKAVTESGFYNFIMGVGFGAMYVSLWYGFKLVNDGTITLGDLTAFQSYIFIIGGGLGSAAKYLTTFIEGQGASGRIFYLLNRIPAIPTPFLETKQTDQVSDHRKDNQDSDERDCEVPPHRSPAFVPQVPPQTPEFMEGAINFKNVHFAYPSRPDVPVLVDFTLCIAPNTSTALVGTSGAGKCHC